MKNLFYLLLIMILSTSCSKKIVFTSELRKKLEGNDINVKQLQFYNSNTIILQRKMDTLEVKVEKGEVKYESAALVEEVIIKKGTPGVCEHVKGKDVLKIGFEVGKDKILAFGDIHNKNTGKYYLLGLKEWHTYRSEVSYDNSIYKVHTPDNMVYLKIKKKVLRKLTKTSRVAKGRTIQ